ncbi:MAG TPA: bifunctional indole-3-glycerol phosphate synthase/phosphoribosylanthranilate isomerase [Acidimicrobiales bacterium]|nr:bifunctional indole-3-glycerol phosphate synthase/phosphoribosylanthranilate isomerase [Acidimicrobiales bacterium]
MGATYLDDIVAWHRRRAHDDDRDWRSRLDAPTYAGPSARSALAAGPHVRVIAEVKRRSPSRGALRADLYAPDQARDYVTGGAAMVSVLTDGPHFGGSLEDLAAVREAVGVPLLRKDFTVSENDVLDARDAGAAAVLLIVAALGDDELSRYHALAHAVGLDALVEVHDEHEAARARDLGATLVGVNQRDLRSFTVDPERAARVAASLPRGCVRVCESGLATPADVRRAADAGFDAVLVGEAFVTAEDPVSAVRAFAAVPARRSLAGSVKICGVTSVEDAVACAEAGADMVGVILADSPRRVAPERARAIVAALEGRATRVAVFKDQTRAEIRAALEGLAIDAVQVHGPLEAGLRDELRGRGLRLIKALSVGEGEWSTYDERHVDAVLVDGPVPGSGRRHGFLGRAERPFRVPVIVAGGLDAANVAEVVAATGADGVDCATGVEVAPGRKDPVKVREFVAAARAALGRTGVAP